MTVGWKPGRQHDTEACYRMGAAKLDIDPSEYAEKRASGQRWCFRCQQWQDANLFGRHGRTRDGIDTQCIESRNAYAREYQRRRRAVS